MKLILPAWVGLLLTCSPMASAQQPTTFQPVAPADGQVASASQLHGMTPELWLYSQEWRRHDDPAQAVRRKAEARTAQRMQRLAAMKWFGFSNSRPQASVTPFTSMYSPAWTGNGYHPYEWVGSRHPTATVLVESYGYRR